MLHAADTDFMTGTLFDDRYLINHLVARGGMGNIYQAHDIKRGHIVAVKMLRREYDDDIIVLKRFLREAKAVQNLHHPNICQLYDIGCTRDKIHYFTMEYLEGRPLDKILQEQHTLPLATTLHYIIDIASALCDAHNHNIIHRDLKPANIFVIKDADGKECAKLLDFGVAKLQEDLSNPGEKLTNAGSTLGTPYYMSPEQIQGLEVDGRADVYSLGIIMWECLFGTQPFNGKTIIDIFNASIHQKLPKLPRNYNNDAAWRKTYAVLEKALQKTPQKRYDSMQSFLRALEELQIAQSSAHPQRVATRTHPSLPVMDIIHSISPLKLVITGSLLIACIGAIVATIFFMRPQQVEIPQTRVGTYKFFSNISAEVRINDEHLGITPLSWQLYTPPPFTITFRDDNRTEYQFKVDNYPEDIAGFAVNFSKSKSPHPMITAETTPPGATVYINDVRYPLQTPCQLAAPESGQLKLTFKLNKYHDENIFILTNTGDFKLHTNLYPR